VFQHDEWITEVQKNYVLVALDFPRAEEIKAKVPNPERNEELKDLYEIGGFPTILLMTADGDVFGQTGYKAGGPAAYLEHMSELRETGMPALVEIKELTGAFDKAEGDDAKWAAWDKVAARFEKLEEGSPFVRTMTPAIRWALEADADNAKGAKVRAVKALLGAGAVTEELIEAALTLDPKNEAGMLDKVAMARFSSVRSDETARAALAMLDRVSAIGFKDNKLAFKLNMQAASWCAGPLSDAEGKTRYAEAAKAIGTDDPEAQKALDELLK